MDGLWAEPVRPVANPRKGEGAESEGAVFFGYFLLGKQKKVTGGQWMPTSRHMDVESVFATASNLKHHFRRPPNSLLPEVCRPDFVVTS